MRTNGSSASPGVRVLFMHHGQDWIRGSERCMLSLVQSVAEKGGIADVVCTSETLAKASREFARRVTVVPAWKGIRRFPSPARIVEAYRLVRQSDPTVVHFNSVDAIVHALPVLGILRIPSIAHIHIQDPAESLRYTGVHRVSRVVAVGKFGEKELLAGGFSRTQVRMIPNGVDFDALLASPPLNVRSRFNIGPGAVGVASVGSLIQRKRPLLAVEAVAATADVHLVFIGGGELEARAREYAVELGVSDRVHFVGETKDVGAWLRGGVDAVVAPSSQEALPLGVIEATGTGLPILASDIGPHAELLSIAADSMLFRTDDALDFSAQLRELSGWPRHRLGAEATRVQAVHARATYSLASFCNAFDALYRELGAISAVKLMA